MLYQLIKPRIFDIEASSVCNIHCAFCPREKILSTGFMSESTFLNFLRKARPTFRDSVSFVGMGEPTLNPLLTNFIKITKEKSPAVKTWVTTNGTNLNAAIVSQMVEARLDVLDVSFNGVTSAEYEKWHRGAKFERVLYNIKEALVVIKNKKSTLRLQINCTLPSLSKTEIKRVKSFWKNIGISNFRFHRLHNRAGHLPMVNKYFEKFSKGYCQVFKFITFITWDGKVLYCSHDLRRKNVIGDINKDEWRSIQDRKRKVLARNQWIELCQNCCDNWKNNLIKEMDVEIARSAWEMIKMKKKLSLPRK